MTDWSLNGDWSSNGDWEGIGAGASGVVVGEGTVTATGYSDPQTSGVIAGEGLVVAVGLTPGAIPQASGVVTGEGTLAATGSTTSEASGTVQGEGTIVAVGVGFEPEPVGRRSTVLRFEAWTLPSTGTFEKRFDLPHVLPGASGPVELSTYSDAQFAVPATFSKLDQLVSTTTGSLIKVFNGSHLIDEFEAARVDIPAGRPNVRTVSGPQRNGLLEGIGIAPKDYPNHDPGAMHWKWGARNILPEFKLEKLGSIHEEWEIALLGERYQLDLSSATAGTFTLNAGSDTSAITWDASGGGIKSPLEALAGIDEVSVVETDTDSRVFWVVFETPKDLGSNMTANFTSLTGGGTLTKFNDGFSATTETFTITVDGQTTSPALDWDASANDVEGTATIGTGLQGLSNVDDVVVTGSGKFGDPWVIVFNDPANPTTFSVTFAAGTHIATKTVEGALDPSPITESKPVDAGTAPEEDHGAYGNPEIEVAFTPLDTGAEWTLQVNAEARYAGTQIRLSGLTPGQTYSNISVPVYPELAGTYVLLIKDLFENMQAQTTPRDVPLSAGSYQNLTIPTFTAIDEEVVVRVAVTDDNPNNIGTFYVSWQTATFLEGEPEASFTKITRELLEAAQDRGVGAWVELDATDSADTAGTLLDDLSYTAFVGDNSNLVNVHLDQGRKDGYQWQLVPEADAQVITPAGTTTHVLQIFYVAADEIEDLTASPGGPSLLVGAHVSEAQLVTRRHPYTTLIGLGTGAVSAEDTDSAAEAAVGRVERIVDVDHLGTPASIQAHLDAQFAEQVLNQKALSATVLGSATQLPGVDYGAGSKIWWQFPGIHAKEARPVKRWSWVHGNIATFQVQGSRVLTKEAAMAAAVDMFLRRPGRRRDQKRPVSATTGDGGGAPTIVVAASDASELSKRKADFRCDGVNDQEQLQSISNRLGNDGGRLLLTEGNFNFTGLWNPTNNVSIQGMGSNATFISGTVDLTALVHLGQGRLSDVFIGNFSSNTLAEGVELRGQESLMENCVVLSNGGAAIRIDTGLAQVRKCHVHNANIGIRHTAGQQVWITDNYIEDVDVGIDTTNAAVHVKGNTIAASSIGINTLFGNEAVIIDNNVQVSAGDGIFDRSTASIIAHNQIVVAGGSAILCGSIETARIIGNRIVSNQTGIELTSSPDFVLIADNYIETTGVAGSGFFPLHASNIDYLAIVNNQIDTDSHLDLAAAAETTDAFGIVADNIIRSSAQCLAIEGEGWSVQGNTLQPGEHAITVNSIAPLIEHNLLILTGLGAANTYDGIQLSVDTDDAFVLGNKLIIPSAGNTPRYGINIAGGNNNAVYANYLGDSSAYGTADSVDSGTGTQTSPTAGAIGGQFAY